MKLNVSRSLRLCVWTVAFGGVIASGQNPQGGNPPQNPGTSPQQQRGQTPGSTTQPGGTRPTGTTESTASGSFSTRAMEINSAEIQLGQLALKQGQNQRVKDFAQMMVKDHSDAIGKFRNAIDDNRRTEQDRNDPTRANTPQAGNTPANTQNRQTDSANRDNRGQTTATSDLPALSPEHRQLMTKLQGMKGADFDREYMNAMVKGHQDTVRLFEQYTTTSEGAQTNPGTARDENSPSTARGQGEITRGPQSQQPGAPNVAGGASQDRGPDVRNLASEMLPTIKRHLQEAESIQKSLK